MNFSEKIDLFMKQHSIPDLKHFSSLVGVPYTTLIDIYKKKTAENSRFSTVKKLCDYMNCTLDYLAYDDILEKNEVKKR